MSHVRSATGLALSLVILLSTGVMSVAFAQTPDSITVTVDSITPDGNSGNDTDTDILLCAANSASSGQSSSGNSSSTGNVTCPAGQFCNRDLIANQCLAVNPCGAGQTFQCSGTSACNEGPSCSGACCTCVGGGSSSSGGVSCQNDECVLMGGNAVCQAQGKGCVDLSYGQCYVCAGLCGNHALDTGEDCDDGNTVNDGNGCLADCTFENAFCAFQ